MPSFARRVVRPSQTSIRPRPVWLSRSMGSRPVLRKILLQNQASPPQAGHITTQALGPVIQQAPAPARQRVPKLLTDFEAKFRQAAAYIRNNTEAMKLVRRAAKAGVKFGGYVKGSAHKGLTAYTDYGTKTVYVPHTQTDPVLAMSDFVFELRNAMQAGKLSTTWSKAKKRQINAYQFAYNNVAIEVESALSTGLIWSQSPLRRRMGRRQRKKYDKANYLSMYLAYKSGKKTKDQLIKQALKRTYKSGIFRGWTVEKKFTEQYKSIPRP